ncbi:MAG: hypothetical protein K6A30_06925 [Lachnospiraceae bacterium]|nr:hypothetical protein [Lachnospiraceae bacterium]
MKLKNNVVWGTISTICVMIMLMMPLASVTVRAEGAGRMVLGLSDTTGNVGDKVIVYATAKDASNQSVSADMTITYNASVLEYVGSNASSANASGSTVTANGSSINVTFKVIGAGSCNFVVKGKNDAGSLTSAGAGFTASAEGETEAEPKESPKPSEEVKESATPEKTQETTAMPTFEIDGKTYEVSSNYSQELINKGFTQTDVTVQGVDVKGLSYGDQWLVLYLVNTEDDSDNGYYLYDKDKEEICPYLGYSVGEEISSDQDTDSAEKYDKLSKDYDDLKKTNRKMLIGIIVGVVVFVLILINLIIFRKINGSGEDEYEDEDEDEDEDQIFEQPVKSVKTKETKQESPYLKEKPSKSVKKDEEERLAMKHLAEDVGDVMKQEQEPVKTAKKAAETNDDGLEIIDFEDL